MKKARRVLVYGFGPYRQFRENITAKIVRSLEPKPGLKRVVFRVRFDRAQFLKAVKRHRPEVVLGLGQSSRRRIEIETRALNRRRARKGARARPIRERGPRWLPTTLELNLGPGVQRSNNAGDYVCNFSAYVMLDHFTRSSAKARLGFVHVPYDFPVRQATRVVVRALRRLHRDRVRQT